MGRVQSSFYNRQASSNTKITNALPLGENQTYYKHLNDIIRQLMADIREESDEVRALIIGQNGNIATARSTAATAQSRANEAATLANGLQSQVSTAVSAASTASSQAVAAQSAASSASMAAATAEATAEAVQLIANSNQTAVLNLDTRVTALEDAAATGTGNVQTDGTTVTSTNGILHAIDAAVEGDTTDLASDRGQIGRTAITDAETMDGLVLDGWYAVGSDTSGKPADAVEGVCRVSSSHASGATFQTFFSCGDESARVFWRCTVDGTNWTPWSEPVSTGALGDGLSYENGVLDVVFPEVLPDTSETDEEYVLTARGTWEERVKPEAVEAVAAGLDELEASIAALQEKVDAYAAVSAAEPDGTTIAIVDGQYSVPLYLGATEEEDGIAGLVPPAEAAATGLFLRSDGTWADPAMETYTFDGSSAGLVPIPDESGTEEETRFLKADGTWEDPCEGLTERMEALEEFDWEGMSQRVAELETFATSAQIDALWPIADAYIDGLFA